MGVRIRQGFADLIRPKNLVDWMTGYGNSFNDPPEVDQLGNVKSRYPYKIYSRKISVTKSDKKSQQNEKWMKHK